MDRQLSDAQVGRMFSQFGKVAEEFGENSREQERFIKDLEARWASAAGKEAVGMRR